jgi:hypothetical protein
MGKLFEARQKIETVIKAKSLDAAEAKGSIGFKTGLLLGLITPTTPDDPVKFEKLARAVKEILGVEL